MKRIYADNAATKRMDQEIMEIIMEQSINYGNASAIYKEGREARCVIEQSRIQIAKLINAEAKEIYFTSGGTESDNWALQCVAGVDNGEKRILTTLVEHKAILKSCSLLKKMGNEIDYLTVDENCIVNLEEIEKKLQKKNYHVISVMYANNEIGTIMPVYQIGEMAKYYGVTFHTDAVQAVGHVDIDVKKQNIDMLSASAHKFGGPKGIGFLYVREGIKIQPFVDGGSQERGMRAGTENTCAIAAMATALKNSLIDMQKKAKYIGGIRDYIEGKIIFLIQNVSVQGRDNKRLSGHSSICFRDVDGLKLVQMLDRRGMSVSTGSACNNNDIRVSHVLKAMGIDDEWSKGAIRISLDENNTYNEADRLVDAITECVSLLRK